MQRVLEPELMQGYEQVKAYAEADFSVPHNHFIELIVEQLLGQMLTGAVLDLGCGPGDVSVRFARKFNAVTIDAVDGSQEMLSFARNSLPETLQQRVRYLYGYLPDAGLSSLKYQTIISNSLLHHLPDPGVLWQTIKQYAVSGARIFVMDLLRPESISQARKMVSMYASEEPEILQTDFFNSLLAAFTLDEIKDQLNSVALVLSVRAISDRHIFIYGKV